MKTVVPKKIMLQKDDDGLFWLIFPHAAICLNEIGGPITKNSLIKWAEKEIKRK